MGKQVRKYNPGFLTPQELVDSFCVRTAEFGLIVQTLRESTGNSNSHQIVIGPRGSGKTTLLLRVAAEVNRDADLRPAWFPIVFAEESYEVATCGEFWLQCLDNLAQQAPPEYEQADLHLALDEFRPIQDDRALADRCLAAILDFADSVGKRLVLIVENLNTLFNDIGDPDVGWQLRKTLQDEPRILLLGSATARFEEIDNSSRALYDLFQVHTLNRLTPEGCATLWKSVSGRDIDARVVRSLQILTGGNPRLLVIVAQFGAQLSFGDLMRDLLNLVDEHTEYFRSHLESLGPQERRVYLALAVLWKPATSKQVSDRARIPTSQCSSLLGRLVQRGAVVRSGGTRHRREYYLAERMYNIYYLLRASRGTERVVEALVGFMASYYSPAELVGIREHISLEATSVDAITRDLMQSVLDRLTATRRLDSDAREQEPSVGTLPSEVGGLVGRARQLLSEGLCDQAIDVCDEVERRLDGIDSPEAKDHSASALVVKCVALARSDDLEAAIELSKEISDLYAECGAAGVGEALASAQVMKVALLGRLDRNEEVLDASEAFLDQFESSDSPTLALKRAVVMLNKGMALSVTGRALEAHAVFDEMIRNFDSSSSEAAADCSAVAFMAKAGLWEKEQRSEAASVLYDALADQLGSIESPTIVTVVALALLSKAELLRENEQFTEALEIYKDASKRLEPYVDLPGRLKVLVTTKINIATLWELKGKPKCALQVYEEIIDRFVSIDSPESSEAVVTAIVNKGDSLARTSCYEEAMVAYDSAVEWYGASRLPKVRQMVQRALTGRAASELALGRAASVITTVDQVIDRIDPDNFDLIVTALMLRSEAYFYMEDRTACSLELAAALKLLPACPSVLDPSVRTLISFAARLGPRPILDLIQESPSEGMLLPLATALREELEIESKVPLEVEEVAQDIRKDLAMLRQR